MEKEKVKEIELITSLDVKSIIKDPTILPALPLEYEDDSMTEINVYGVLEYIPGTLRGVFMDELYRILAPGGKIAISVPYWNTQKAVQDYRYQWPPVTEQSFLYFNKNWREANKIETDLKCNFDFTYGYTAEAETAARSDESRSFYIKHYTNCVDVLHLLLTKAK